MWKETRETHPEDKIPLKSALKHVEGQDLGQKK